MNINEKKIILGRCQDELKSFSDGSFDLIYIDPPFNTGKKQSRKRIKTIRDSHGDRVGFQGKKYKTEVLTELSYDDSFDNFLGFIKPCLDEAYRLLSPNGSFFFHINYIESHYCKILLDDIFGRDCFKNEIIWHWDFGARAKNKWPSKHDTIFWYVKNPNNYTYNYDEIDRIPYMAPDLVGKEKAARGKTPTDTWFITIEPTQSKKRTGYPTQKPYKLLERIIKVHSNPGDKILDFFAGSGTTGEAALNHGRKVVLIDSNPKSIEIIKNRLK
ncbi:MAG: DNA-methyltransferase [Nitrososphaeraceae archaeon]